MKNNGIVSKKSNRRDALSFLLFVFLLPYVCACLWGHVGEQTMKLKEEEKKGQRDVRMVEAALSWGVWELPMEEYLTCLLFLVVPKESEEEALKAQAVLLRTELAARYTEQADKTIFLEAEELSQFYAGEKDAEELAAYRRAVEATTGTILTYEGEPVRASSLRPDEKLIPDGIRLVDPAVAGSGFLALDLNGDGQINDGSELFGTKSGDGFRDLARYDADGNGWIDEADPIWNKLLIWTKDEDGKDKLYHLSDLGVGAIGLSRVGTQFSLNSAKTNEANAIIRNTGIFLYESGTVSTIQHVDMATYQKQA